MQRRRNLCSSIRSLGKLMGKDLQYLPAHPGYYRPFFKQLHPEQCDLTESRIRNIKSDVLFALRQSGSIQSKGSYMAPLVGEWHKLWKTAESEKHMRRYCSRLMHYCSAQNIAPGEVNDEVLTVFLQALIDESFVKNPEKTQRDIIGIWNKLSEGVPAWPSVRLVLPSKRNSYTIPLENFPQSFRDDVAALVNHWSGKDILDETAPMKPLKPRTIKSRLYRLRQIVSALVIQGMPIDEITSLSAFTQVEAAKTALRFYLKRANDQTTSQVHGLAILIKTLAKHWVCVDEEHLEKLKELCSRVDPKFKGLTEKNKSRLRQFDDPRNVRLLLNFPQQQVVRIQRDDRGLRNQAVAVQIALAVEILLMAPMRAANLVNINIERHIQRSRNGQAGVVHIVIPGSEVKNGDDLEYELPQETVELLDVYLKHYHPRLADGDCPWLFPGKGKGSKTRELFGDQISRHVFKATGLSINLHLFRHISAKLYLDNNPGGYEVVRRHLGHRSTETTLRFYSGTEQAAASRHFDATILQLRHGTSSAERAG